MSEQASHLLSCSMRVGEIVKLLRMIATHPEFSEVAVVVNSNRSTFPPAQAATISPREALVNIKIPLTTNMPSFFGSFSKALNKK